jgi:hypothetical protein
MNQKVSKKYYLYAILTIIPIVGLIIGILLVRKGILLKNRILLYLGVFGIFLTASFFIGGLLYSKYSDVGKAKRVELARISLDEVMRDIEYYKIQFGVYPDSLDELKSVDRMVFIMDPLSQQGIFSTKLNSLHYKKIDSSHYTLFSAGFDRIPNTNDDVYPYIAASQKSGLVKIKWKTSE